MIALYNCYGDINCRYTYDSWGNLIAVTDANGNAITDPTHIANINPIRYRGYYYDVETGLYYLQSRYYNPQWGRFLNADDMGVLSLSKENVLGTNLFAYCENNPVNDSDPSGMLKTKWIIGAVEVAIIIIPVLFSISQTLKRGRLVANLLSRVQTPLAKMLGKVLLKVFKKKTAALIAADVLGAMFKVIKYISKISVGWLVEYIVDCLDGKRDHNLNTKAKLKFRLILR